MRADHRRAGHRPVGIYYIGKSEGVTLRPAKGRSAFTSFEMIAFWGYHTSRRDSICPGPPALDNPFLPRH